MHNKKRRFAFERACTRHPTFQRSVLRGGGGGAMAHSTDGAKAQGSTKRSKKTRRRTTKKRKCRKQQQSHKGSNEECLARPYLSSSCRAPGIYLHPRMFERLPAGESLRGVDDQQRGDEGLGPIRDRRGHVLRPLPLPALDRLQHLEVVPVRCDTRRYDDAIGSWVCQDGS